MKRYLLDTNVLIFLIIDESSFKEISNDTKLIISDFSNVLTTSSICIFEIMQLVRIGKIKSKVLKTAEDYINSIEEANIKIEPFTSNHTRVLSNLETAPSHNDPFDHAIISHAIADKFTLVSSDTKFDFYKNQKLKFHFNKR